MKKTITVLTPCFNEEEGIRECVLAVRQIFEHELPQYDLEHLFIDNCSQDRTVDILREMAALDKRIKVIVNSRNFGPNFSPYYGILQAGGDAVIQLVADLQTPPQLMVEFVRRWEEGNLMVLGVRRNVEGGFLLRSVRRMFYLLIVSASRVEQIPNFIGFGLFDRKIINILRDLGDHSPYFRGIIAEIGFDKILVEYDQPPRKHGKTHHNLSGLIDIALLGLSNYSHAPLRLMTFYGGIISFFCFLVAFGYLIAKLVYWDSFNLGIAPAVIGIFFFGSVQLFCLGILGEYLSRIFEHVRRRPLVLEKERINFDLPEKPGQ